MKHFSQPSTTENQHSFSAIPQADIERSSFNRSHGHKTTFDAGNLYPVYLDEVLPGDTFSMSATTFGRLNTPLKPFMDNLYLDLHFFFVPNRLVWDNFQKFMGERINPDDDPTQYTIPQTLVSLSRADSRNNIASYFGIPFAQGSGNISVNALPFRAYLQIYNDWYRDQNFMPTIPFSRGDTDVNNLGNSQLYGRSKSHDYFTSALPWPQKGDAVNLPLGTTAPVIGSGSQIRIGLGAPEGMDRTVFANNTNMAFTISGSAVATPTDLYAPTTGGTGYEADLRAATAITINDLRTAFQIQRLLERDARGGTRYVEILKAHFSVTSPDARLQRAEYLGGGHSMVNVTPIAATYAGTEVAQGQLAGYGTVLGKASFQKSFVEHGFIMGIMSVRSDLNYQNGLERFWSKKTRYDFYWPALAHLGEQQILNKEIWTTGGDGSVDNQTWGYQERYAEYRYKPSRVTGILSSNYATSLDVWHLAQDFPILPTLNAFFLIDKPPIERVVAVTSEPHFIADIWFNLICQRPMPTYSVPGMVDHF